MREEDAISNRRVGWGKKQKENALIGVLSLSALFFFCSNCFHENNGMLTKGDQVGWNFYQSTLSTSLFMENINE